MLLRPVEKYVTHKPTKINWRTAAHSGVVVSPIGTCCAWWIVWFIAHPDYNINYSYHAARPFLWSHLSIKEEWDIACAEFMLLLLRPDTPLQRGVQFAKKGWFSSPSGIRRLCCACFCPCSTVRGTETHLANLNFNGTPGNDGLTHAANCKNPTLRVCLTTDVSSETVLNGGWWSKKKTVTGMI